MFSLLQLRIGIIQTRPSVSVIKFIVVIVVLVEMVVIVVVMAFVALVGVRMAMAAVPAHVGSECVLHQNINKQTVNQHPSATQKLHSGAQKPWSAGLHPHQTTDVRIGEESTATHACTRTCR